MVINLLLELLQTIFEICSKNKSTDYIAMKAKRVFHKEHIESHHRKLEQLKAEHEEQEQQHEVQLPSSNQEDIDDAFQHVVLPKKRKLDDLYKKKAKKMRVMRDDNYIPYIAPDRHTEEG